MISFTDYDKIQANLDAMSVFITKYDKLFKLEVHIDHP